MPPAPGIALITGASSGLGVAFAHRAATDRHALVLVARRRDRLEALAAELRARHGVAVTVRATDLSNRSALEALAADILSGSQRVDILVNNAGVGLAGPVLGAPPPDLAVLLDVDIAAPTLLLRAALPAMVARRSGHVLNVASLAAFQPGPNAAAYCAAKAYLKSFSEAVAFELRGTGVHVTALCPGPVATGFADASGHQATRLFSGLIPVATAARTAELGWGAMLRGRPSVVAGPIPRLLASLGPLTPRALTLRISAYLLGRTAASGEHP